MAEPATVADDGLLATSPPPARALDLLRRHDFRSALSRRRRERARHGAPLHRPDVVRVRRGRAARRRRGEARGQRAGARLRPARRRRRRPLGPAAHDDRRRPRARGGARPGRRSPGSSGTCRSPASSSPRSCSRRRRATSRRRTGAPAGARRSRQRATGERARPGDGAGALVGGWAVAALLVAVLPISTFFAVNAASFLISAAFIARCPDARGRVGRGVAAPARGIRGAAGRGRRSRSASPCSESPCTISAGTWIGGVPTLVRDSLHHGAGGFSIVMVGYALGAIVSGAAAGARAGARARRWRASSRGSATCPGTG